MRRGVIVAVAVLALLGVLAPPSFAQAPAAAPAPKVTINGLIDNVGMWGNNAFDTNFAQRKDSIWGARTRGVFTITGEVGRAKGVLALEIDLGWGQVSSAESVNSNGGGSTSINGSAGAVGSPQRAFQQGGFDIGNDVSGVIEIKNLYVEFPVPLIPLPTLMRLGGQPFQVTYKPSALATTDYGGVWLSTTITPNLKVNFTYAQAEEDDVGVRASAGNAFFRGDDVFLAASVDVTPFQGLDIRPIVGYYTIYGNSFQGSRCRVQCGGQPSNGSMVAISQFTNGVTTAPNLGNYRQNSHETRWYFGLDSRLTAGPFYLDPTVIYERSHVDVYRNLGTVGGFAGGAALGTALPAGLAQGFGPRVHQSIESWLVDIRAGWRLGPLLVEGIVIYTPGDDAQHDMWRSSRVYHGVAADGAYSGSWNEILTPGSVDYFTGNGIAMGENWGLGRWGRRTVGTKITYSVTPAFDVNFKASANWTDTKVDVDAPVAAGTAAAPGSWTTTPCGAWNGRLAASPGGGTGGQAAFDACARSPFGDHRFMGVEIDPGITYRFAPGVTFDMVYAHLFTGSAFDTSFVDTRGVYRNRVEAKDADFVAARVRYQF
jgi:hypothetical protein